MITNNIEWDFAGVFADVGSGLIMDNRDQFNDMILKAMAGEIDLILTKSISRFLRNTLDSLKVIRALKERMIAVEFEKENINTLDEKGGLLLEVMSGFAQEEVRNLSEDVKWGYQKRFRNGKVLTKYKNFMGYTCDNGQMVIVPEQAIIVEKIFDLYLEGKTLNQIKVYLEDNLIKTVTGKEKWHTDTLNKMLSNEKYMGDSILQKTCTVDYLSKKRKRNDGIIDKYYVADTHPAIISKEKFEKVQQEKVKRAGLIKNNDGSVTVSNKKYSGKYQLGNLLVCGECGAAYRRRTERGKVIWRCATRMEKGRECCKSSPSLDEQYLKKFIFREIGHDIESDGEDIIKNEIDQIRVCADRLIIIMNSEIIKEVCLQ